MSAARGVPRLHRRSGGPLSGHVITPQELAGGDRSLWRALCDSDPVLANPFYCVQFTEAVADCGVDVRLCVLEQDGRTVGYFPFQFRNKLTRWLGAAERVGEEMSDYCGLVAEADLKIDVRELLRLSRLSSFSFSHLDETQCRHGLSGEKPEIGLLSRMERGGAAYWQELCAKDTALARDTRRRTRGLTDKLGPLRFEFQERHPHAALEHLINAKRDQYTRTKAPDALAEGWKHKLLHRLADTDEQGFAGVLSTLHAGDTWLASHFGIRSRDVLHHWFPVYNPDMSRYAPGRLLNQSLVEAADEHRYSVIDFGAGDSAAKQDFANASHNFSRGRWQRPGPKSLSFEIVMSAKWRLDSWRATKSS